MAYRGNILTGARARLSIDGVTVALAMGVTYGEEIQLDPVEPLDQLDVAEHVPVRYRVSFSARFVRIVANTIKNRDGVVIFPKFDDILTRGEATATIEDNVTGRVLANIERVKASRYNVSIDPTGIVLNDVEFVAIRIRNESEIT